MAAKFGIHDHHHECHPAPHKHHEHSALQDKAKDTDTAAVNSPSSTTSGSGDSNDKAVVNSVQVAIDAEPAKVTAAELREPLTGKTDNKQNVLGWKSGKYVSAALTETERSQVMGVLCGAQ